MKNNKKIGCLVIVLAASFTATFNTSALSLSIPGIEATFTVSAKAVGWAVTMYTLTNVAFSLPCGKLAEIVGLDRVMKSGILSFALGSFLAIVSGTFGIFLFARFLQGLGGAMIFCTGNAILAGVYDKEERGKALGYSTAAIYLGLSLGPVVGGVLNNWFGWRSIILAVGVVMLIAFGLSLKMLPEIRIKEGAEFDIRACVLYIVAIVLAMYGFSNIGGSALNYVLLAAGIILIVIFVRYETKAKDQILKVELFRNNRGFSNSNTAALMNYAATYAVSYFLSLYLQLARGYSSQLAGIMLITIPLFQTALSPFAGRLSDKVSPYKLAPAGMAVCSLSLLMLSLVKLDTPMPLIIVIQAVMGSGYAFFSSPNTNAVMGSVRPEDLGLASSVLATMRTIGQTASMGIVTIIVGLKMGTQAMSEVAPDLIVSTMKTVFVIFAVVCASGVFFASRKNTD